MGSALLRALAAVGGLVLVTAGPPVTAGSEDPALRVMEPAHRVARDVTLDLRARAFQPGEVVVATIGTTRPATRVDVRAFERLAPAYRESEHTWRALVGIDLDVAPGQYSIGAEATLDSSTAKAAQSIVVLAKEFRTRTLTVDPDFVTPPAAVQARIAEEARLLAALWQRPPSERLWAGPFERPVEHQANSAFGTRSVFNGEPRNPHTGADFLSPAGTIIRAPNRGRVVVARDLYFSGGTVILDHGLGLFSTFAHLSRRDVAEGAVVERGQALGLVGATGRVTGAHLHWAVRLGGARVDPLSLLAADVSGPAR
jgi:murein DD-endopeptidase MepM/ murein hydrolase activator NlpD